MSKPKKKFKETKVGIFLKEKAPTILDTVGEFLPDQGGLGIDNNGYAKMMYPGYDYNFRNAQWVKEIPIRKSSQKQK